MVCDRGRISGPGSDHNSGRYTGGGSDCCDGSCCCDGSVYCRIIDRDLPSRVTKHRK